MADFIGLTPQEQNLWQLFEPTAADCGLELVRIKLTQAATPTLEVLADKPNAKPGNSITLDECADLSRRLGRLLDVEDVMPSAFNLEVSSPGVERPYATVEALKKAEGMTVKAKVSVPVDGLGAIKGVLANVTETTLTIGEHTTEIQNIRTVKRVLSENDMKALMKGMN